MQREQRRFTAHEAKTMTVNNLIDNLEKQSAAKRGLVDALRQQIQSVTSAVRASDGSTFSSGCQAIDRMLPSGGYSRGIINQWFLPPSHSSNRSNQLSGGYGAKFLSLLTASRACQDGQALVIVDPDHTFYPPAAAAMRVQLSNVIILRPESPCLVHQSKDMLWAIDQSLRCNAVGAVWGHVGDVDPRWLRRFQLSAEQSGAVGILIRPGHCASHPSWSEIDWQVKPQKTFAKTRRRTAENSPHTSNSFRVHLSLLRAPGGFAEQSVTLEINTVSGNVQVAREINEKSSMRLASQLAYPATRRRTARA